VTKTLEGGESLPTGCSRQRDGKEAEEEDEQQKEAQLKPACQVCVWSAEQQTQQQHEGLAAKDAAGINAGESAATNGPGEVAAAAHEQSAAGLGKNRQRVFERLQQAAAPAAGSSSSQPSTPKVVLNRKAAAVAAPWLQ
jgi:hypothetical protein